MSFLFWLQIIGALLSALGSAHKALKSSVPSAVAPDPNYPDEVVEKDHTKLVNRIEWGLILGGLLIALLSTIVQQHNSKRSAIQAQEQVSIQFHQAEVQINKATEVLGRLEFQSRMMRREMVYLDRLVGQFDSLKVNITYELSGSNLALRPFFDRVRELAEPPIPVATDSNVFLFSLVGKTGRSPAVQSRREQKEEGVYSLNEVGYMKLPQLPATNGDQSGLMGAVYLPGSGAPVDFDDVCSSNWLAGIESDTNLVQFIGFIRSPVLLVRMFARQTPELRLERADFSAPSAPATGYPQLAFNFAVNRALLVWEFHFPADEWRQTVRIGSVRDLDTATLCVNFLNAPDCLRDTLQPVTSQLRVARSTLAVEEFGFFAFQDYRVPYATNLIPTGSGTEYAKIYYRTNVMAIFKTTLPPPAFNPIGEDSEESEPVVKRLELFESPRARPDQPFRAFPTIQPIEPATGVGAPASRP